MALLYIETFKQSIASVTKQYNLVLAKVVGKHADWACVQDVNQAEPLVYDSNCSNINNDLHG